MRNRLKSENFNVGEITNKLTKELDDVTSLDKIKDIEIDSDRRKIKLYTHALHIIDSDDVRYYGGHYKITIPFNSNDIKIESDNPRKSHWSHSDYHPHVSHEGNPCFGSFSATIAELSGQFEFYALTTVLLEFLQHANIDDCAGACVRYWDICDENGHIIEYGDNPDEEKECYDCHNIFTSDSLITAYVYIDSRDRLREEHLICNDCVNGYEYLEDYDAYVRDV